MGSSLTQLQLWLSCKLCDFFVCLHAFCS